MKISYCPISKDYYLLMRDMLGTDGVQRVLLAVCDDFFNIDGDPEFDFESKSEDAFYEHLLGYAKEKGNAWYNRHKNFYERNPKKKQAVDQDP